MKDKKVIIKWVDSRQIHGWTFDNELEDTPVNIETIGHLAKETDDAYIVALSKGEQPVQYNGINVIPKCCVVSIKEIKCNE